jgi:UDP-2-acetamido-2-deoxy-ribo-hexuluronate aminotransferase
MIPFIDLKSQYLSLEPVIRARIDRVLAHGQYVMGPEVAELEERLAAHVGVRHCIAASSGTDTLLIALMALGIGAGDEVITTPFSFIATAEMIALSGAVPVFADIEQRTCNIDPQRIEALIGPRTRAIMPVSLYGQCADMDRINAIATRHGLPVIEDAAQSFGATYKGRRSCALSTIGSTSFFPSKPLGAYGDGGALFTDDDALAATMRSIRVHGQERRYHHPRIGINGRLDTLQAAILLAKLERFDWEVEQRQRIGAAYSAGICERCPDVATLVVEPWNTSVYAQYTIQVARRDALAARLAAAGVPTAVHYPLPLHRQPAFAALPSARAELPVADAAAQRVISLPMSADLAPSDQERVIAALCAALTDTRGQP